MKLHPLLGLCGIIFISPPAFAIKPATQLQPTEVPESIVREMAQPAPRYQIGVRIQDGDQLIVQEVVANSPSEKAGIKVADHILSVNGIKLSGMKALQDIITVAGEQELQITIKRGEAQLVVPVIPQKKIQGKVPPSSEAKSAPMPWNVPGQNEGGGRLKLEKLVERHGHHGHGHAKTEALLGEILAELKKLNQREEAKAKPRKRTVPPARVRSGRTESRQRYLPRSKKSGEKSGE